MKLSKIFTVLSVVSLFALASCNKNECYTCTHSTNSTQTLCEDDYEGSDTALNFAVGSYQTDGYICTKN